MNHTRNCSRCGTGTETCLLGDFYTCSVCDVEKPPAIVRPPSYGINPFGGLLPTSLPPILPAPPGLEAYDRLVYFCQEVADRFLNRKTDLRTYTEINALLRPHGFRCGPGHGLDWARPVLVDPSRGPVPPEWSDVGL